MQHYPEIASRNIQSPTDFLIRLFLQLVKLKNLRQSRRQLANGRLQRLAHFAQFHAATG